MTTIEITCDFQYFHEADRPHNEQLVTELVEHIREAIQSHLQAIIDGDASDEITPDIVAASPKLVPTSHDIMIIITARGLPDADRELHWRTDLVRDHLRLWLPFSLTFVVRVILCDEKGLRQASQSSESRPSNAPREQAAPGAA